MQIFVSSSLTTAIKISINAPIFPASAVTSLIWCSPENIVSGKNVPASPSSKPPTTARAIVYFLNLSLRTDVIFLKIKNRYPAAIPMRVSGTA